MELEGVDVVEDEVALGGLVELEFQDLRTAFVSPLGDDFRDRIGGHDTSFLLSLEEFVCASADHEFDFAVDSGLSEWRNGNGEGRL